MILGSLAIAAWLSEYLHPEGSEFLDWSRGGGGFRSFSLAATWEIFVSYPILAYFTLHWIWKQIIWSRFLRSTTHLNLRLIAVHPDHLGGLGFLEASLLAQLPFSFCLGVGLAGAIANRVFHEGQKVIAYRFLAPVLIAVALLISIAPYFLFIPTLIQMRRKGMLKYGALARAVGEKFEQKWLDRDDRLHEDVLTSSDFASTRNLFGIVDYIDDIRVVPCLSNQRLPLHHRRADPMHSRSHRRHPIQRAHKARHEAPRLDAPNRRKPYEKSTLQKEPQPRAP